MLINEDFFNDIDIKEDDIQNIDNTVGITFRNGDEFIEYCRSLYDYSLEIRFEDEDREYIKPNTMKKISKALYHLFDLYGIEHSEAFIIENCFEENKISYKLFDYGYKHLSVKEPEKKSFDEYDEDIVCVMICLNIPVFSKRQAEMFLYRLVKSAFTVYDSRNFKIWSLLLDDMKDTWSVLYLKPELGATNMDNFIKTLVKYNSPDNIDDAINMLQHIKC